jgi:hypothetical protein
MGSTQGVNVTPAEVARHQRDGAILIKSVLTPAELELLERGLDLIHISPRRFTLRQTTNGAIRPPAVRMLLNA